MICVPNGKRRFACQGEVAQRKVMSVPPIEFGRGKARMLITLGMSGSWALGHGPQQGKPAAFDQNQREFIRKRRYFSVLSIRSLRWAFSDSFYRLLPGDFPLGEKATFVKRCGKASFSSKRDSFDTRFWRVDFTGGLDRRRVGTQPLKIVYQKQCFLRVLRLFTTSLGSWIAVETGK